MSASGGHSLHTGSGMPSLVPWKGISNCKNGTSARAGERQCENLQSYLKYALCPSVRPRCVHYYFVSLRLKTDEATLVESSVATTSSASVHAEGLLSRRLSCRRSTCSASKQSGSFTCELFHCQPWTDVSKRTSVPLQSRGGKSWVESIFERRRVSCVLLIWTILSDASTRPKSLRLFSGLLALGVSELSHACYMTVSI
jgi:hypothetical protein